MHNCLQKYREDTNNRKENEGERDFFSLLFFSLLFFVCLSFGQMRQPKPSAVTVLCHIKRQKKSLL